VILSLDYKTLEHTPQEKVKFASLEAAKNIPAQAQKSNPFSTPKIRQASLPSGPLQKPSSIPPTGSLKSPMISSILIMH